jgi:thymidylate kinase
MSADDPIRADDPGRRRNVYGATMEQAMHAGSTDARLDALGAKIDDLACGIDKRFEQADRRIEDRFEQFEKRFEDRLEQTDKRFSERLEEIDKRFSDRFEQADTRLEHVERRLEGFESRFFYLQLTLLGGFLGLIATLIAARL